MAVARSAPRCLEEHSGRGEIAPLSAADVKTDELTNIHSIVIAEDLEQGRRLKTSGFPSVVGRSWIPGVVGWF
jgi:hypothetical protein